MPNRSIVLIFCCSLLLPLLVAPAPVQGQEWTAMYDRDGVRSYRRTPEDSRIQEFSGEGEVPVNAYKVLAVVLDTNRSIEWVADMVEGVSLGMRGPDRELVYTHFEVPWPAKNRDFLYEEVLTYDKSAKSWKVVLKSTTDSKMPEKEDVVRAELFYSEFSVTVLDDNRSWVTVRIHTDPRGELPVSIINLITRTWPWETITRLRKQSITASGYEKMTAELKERFPL